jgi:PHD/YefM family antitoxin component YafN of YafNO toxin-antitoxin module
MLDLTRDFQSLSFFRRKTATFANLLKKNNRPLILTHKGKPELVVQSASAYQRLLDMAARQDAMERIRQGLEDAANGRMRPARAALAEFRARHGIPR